MWDRYCTIAQEAQIDIPSSFQTWRSTFKDKLADHIEDIFKVIVLHDQPQNEACTVLVPSKVWYIPVSAMVKTDTTDIDKLIPSFKYDDQDTFLTMVHVTLQI